MQTQHEDNTMEDCDNGVSRIQTQEPMDLSDLTARKAEFEVILSEVHSMLDTPITRIDEFLSSLRTTKSRATANEAKHFEEFETTLRALVGERKLLRERISGLHRYHEMLTREQVRFVEATGKRVIQDEIRWRDQLDEKDRLLAEEQCRRNMSEKELAKETNHREDTQRQRDSALKDCKTLRKRLNRFEKEQSQYVAVRNALMEDRQKAIERSMELQQDVTNAQSNTQELRRNLARNSANHQLVVQTLISERDAAKRTATEFSTRIDDLQKSEENLKLRVAQLQNDLEKSDTKLSDANRDLKAMKSRIDCIREIRTNYQEDSESNKRAPSNVQPGSAPGLNDTKGSHSGIETQLSHGSQPKCTQSGKPSESKKAAECDNAHFGLPNEGGSQSHRGTDGEGRFHEEASDQRSSESTPRRVYCDAKCDVSSEQRGTLGRKSHHALHISPRKPGEGRFHEESTDYISPQDHGPGAAQQNCANSAAGATESVRLSKSDIHEKSMVGEHATREKSKSNKISDSTCAHVTHQVHPSPRIGRLEPAPVPLEQHSHLQGIGKGTGSMMYKTLDELVAQELPAHGDTKEFTTQFNTLGKIFLFMHEERDALWQLREKLIHEKILLQEHRRRLGRIDGRCTSQVRLFAFSCWSFMYQQKTELVDRTREVVSSYFKVSFALVCGPNEEFLRKPPTGQTNHENYNSETLIITL